MRKDDNAPAMKADIQRVERSLEMLTQSMETGFRHVHQDIDRVLGVLVNVDKRLSIAVSDHERRITRLETQVGIDAR